MKTLPHIKNIIAVASGKGGVGKSTTAVNLALALAKWGHHVGILDADIYGPSQPTMLGAEEFSDMKAKRDLSPVMCHGLQTMSIGYVVKPNAAMIWRGPMVSMALQQLLYDTKWQDLDYLIIDLPPGTGDIQLTLAQKIPVSAAIIVTTPQDLSLLDARRAYEMFIKVHVPVLGIVENMSAHTCANCGHSEAIFGAGGGARLAEEYGLDMLGQIPLDKRIREQTDSGKPTVIAEPEGVITQIYLTLAQRVTELLILCAPSKVSKSPTIVVKDD